MHCWNKAPCECKMKTMRPLPPLRSKTLQTVEAILHALSDPVLLAYLRRRIGLLLGLFANLLQLRKLQRTAHPQVHSLGAFQGAQRSWADRGANAAASRCAQYLSLCRSRSALSRADRWLSSNAHNIQLRYRSRRLAAGTGGSLPGAPQTANSDRLHRSIPESALSLRASYARVWRIRLSW